MKLIKLTLPVTLRYITHIFNHCITTSKFPYVWKMAIINPIPKVLAPKSASDLRPISIIPAISKAFEIILRNEMIVHLKYNDLISSIQSAYRENNSTTTALTNIVDNIRLNMDKKEITFLILLDCTDAFGSINFLLLIQKLNLQYIISLMICHAVLFFHILQIVCKQ